MIHTHTTPPLPLFVSLNLTVMCAFILSAHPGNVLTYSIFTFRTFKKGCPMMLKVSVTGDGQELYVREMSTTHNHDIKEVG